MALRLLRRPAGSRYLRFIDEFLRHYDPDVPGCLVLAGDAGVDGSSCSGYSWMPAAAPIGSSRAWTSRRAAAMRADALNFCQAGERRGSLGAVREAMVG